jgi:hypothetical protein
MQMVSSSRGNSPSDSWSLVSLTRAGFKRKGCHSPFKVVGLTSQARTGGPRNVCLYLRQRAAFRRASANHSRIDKEKPGKTSPPSSA